MAKEIRRKNWKKRKKKIHESDTVIYILNTMDRTVLDEKFKYRNKKD